MGKTIKVVETCKVCEGKGYIIMYRYHHDIGQKEETHICRACQPFPWEK